MRKSDYLRVRRILKLAKAFLIRTKVGASNLGWDNPRKRLAGAANLNIVTKLELC